MLVTVQVVDGKARRHDLFHLGIELPVDLAVIEFPLAGPLDDFRITFRQQAVGLDQGPLASRDVLVRTPCPQASMTA